MFFLFKKYRNNLHKFEAFDTVAGDLFFTAERFKPCRRQPAKKAEG